MTFAITARAARDLLAVGEAHALAPARRARAPLDVAAGLAGAAVILDQAHERLHEPRAAAARNRHPALLHRDADHLGHEPRGGRVGAEAGVQHPGREQSVRAIRGEGVGQPVATRGQHVAGELDRASAAEPPVGLRREPEPVARPELRAEHAEREVGVRQERLDGAAPLFAQLGDVGLGRAEQEGRLAVGKSASPSGGRCSGTRARAPRARRRAPHAPRRRPRAGARR